MAHDHPTKPTPETIAIFGASGRMGSQVADYLAYARPDVRLRLLTSSKDRLAPLRQRFPSAQVAVADYLDRSSVDRALQQMQGVFVVTPSGLDELTAMTNFIDAAHEASAATHVVRIVGYPPESDPQRIPQRLLAHGGDADQHYVAKRLLAASGLPVTFLNVGASLMDNLLLTAPGVRRLDTLIWPQREVPLIDVRDLGEAAARLLLSDDRRHIGQFYTIDNGQDYPTTSRVAEVMSEVLRRPIGHDASWQAFNTEYGETFVHRFGRDDEPGYRFEYFRFEYLNWMWSLNDFGERLLGRPLTNFRSWMQEHRQVFTP